MTYEYTYRPVGRSGMRVSQSEFPSLLHLPVANFIGPDAEQNARTYAGASHLANFMIRVACIDPDADAGQLQDRLAAKKLHLAGAISGVLGGRDLRADLVVQGSDVRLQAGPPGERITGWWTEAPDGQYRVQAIQYDYDRLFGPRAVQKPAPLEHRTYDAAVQSPDYAANVALHLGVTLGDYERAARSVRPGDLDIRPIRMHEHA